MLKELWDIIKNGITDENAVFSLALGLCPALAVTTTLENGIGMGIALIFVLSFSVGILSALRKWIQPRVRIPVFLAVIACFVTITDLSMKAYLPSMAKSLGIFVPLIVVNCIVLGRVEVFASKNPPHKAIADGIGMGVGFTAVLALIGLVREVLGSGCITFGGKALITFPFFKPALLMALAPGGFLTIGVFMALIAWYRKIQLRSQIASATGVRHEDLVGEEPPDEISYAGVTEKVED
jgi:electron transport complex protein RnfE